MAWLTHNSLLFNSDDIQGIEYYFKPNCADTISTYEDSWVLELNFKSGTSMVLRFPTKLLAEAVFNNIKLQLRPASI